MEERTINSKLGNFFKCIRDFIGKDVTAKNESKKLIVIIRILIISIFAYFILNGIISIPEFNFETILFYGIFLSIFIGIFALSYHCRSLVILWIFNISMMIWICTIVKMYGCNIGVQHFIMVLLILYFFSSYKQYAGKILYAIFLCSFRILLYFIYNKKESVWTLTLSEENLLQITNTITIFWCISVIAFIFSNNSQELESKLIEYNAQLEKQANTDTLTGLYNRRKAMEYMEYLVKNQSGSCGFSLCICDIDFFKKVNDNYGHDFGDEVLKSLSKLFLEEIGEKNFAARWGGEEFLLLFPECNGDNASDILEKLRRKIKNMKVKKDDLEISVTMTFGLAEYDFINGLTATISEADKKLYMGKEKGRDIVIF